MSHKSVWNEWWENTLNGATTFTMPWGLDFITWGAGYEKDTTALERSKRKFPQAFWRENFRFSCRRYSGVALANLQKRRDGSRKVLYKPFDG
jgi:hypothetical protein